ncbi:Eco29kI family restriction endonuclease [Actinomycetospora lemnae]|uniref:Eco29kI family restriction endonuclease n=1 Tax=Actinomycetospora lemnae TaxID=3019891 RepID=A0ABT5T069_9PSEU|nr:Eco29kI family restriction endonuclease [Actinomycetospora sp. DW7H6]MDD7968519.1 Eco29kI family restriction endonuclease [Actinomycetospora sp. DW7H6]
MAQELDPILQPSRVFDPNDPTTAARVIALTMVCQSRVRLDEVTPFYGSGVYVLYYNGPFEPYARISRSEQPIYAGKAEPTDPNAARATSQGPTLHRRLDEHARSIRAASSTLSIQDFECRYLVTRSGYQKAAEAELISFFKPIWNKEYRVCHGVGKHGDASDTRKNKRSPWDTLHPGRLWAEKTEEDQKPREEILRDIDRHLDKFPPREQTRNIVESLIAELDQASAALREHGD